MIITTIGFVDLTDSTSYTYLILMSTFRRIGMALMLMPIQTAGLNQLPASLTAHGTAISNTIRQVAGAVGTSLLVTIMTTRTETHLTDAMSAGGNAANQAQMMLDATIQGINDAYVVIIGIAIVGLILSFFIKKVSPGTQSASQTKKQQALRNEPEAAK